MLGIWRVPAPGLHLYRANLRSFVAVEPAQLLARHGLGRRIVVRSGSVVGFGRGYGCVTRDLGTPSNRRIPSPMALPFPRHSTLPASFQFTSHLALHVVLLLRETMLFE
jgi:hypothetical protein